LKIEKINDHQIRCVLTKNDLEAHAIKLSELAYGSEKAKGLFRDMMRQAEREFGFEAEDIPLMIEAIPYSEHVVLIITKVEDPEELDTKFSNFAPGVREGDPMIDEMIQELSGAAEVLDLFKKIQDCVSTPHNKQFDAHDLKNKNELAAEENENEEESPNLTRVFVFSTLSHVQKLARVAGKTYRGINSLYKDEAYDTYILVTTCDNHSREEYNRFCNMASEYGSMHKSKESTERYLEEHFEPIIKDNALAILSEL